MNPYLAATREPSTPSIYGDKEFRHNHQVINDAIHRNDKDYLRSHVRKPAMGGPVNLSEDPLLNVLIAYRKSSLAIELLKEISEADLEGKNYDGDTALHVAVMEGDVEVATALIKRKKDLLHARNKQGESPLHKAALYGEREIFWLLEEEGGDCNARGKDGATVLHCAIMGNAPRLALEIASTYPLLMSTRNSRAVTPLQLVVTITDAFRSKLSLGSLEALIYEYIPLEGSIPANKILKGDIEKQVTQENSEHLCSPVGAAANEEGQHFVMRYRSTFPPNYATCFDMLSIACIPVFARVEFLQQQKTNHEEAMKLVEYLARDPGYWDFIVKGRTGTESSLRPGDTMAQSAAHATMQQQNELKGSQTNESKRWDESPLTPGAKMCLHEILERILKLCPQSEAKESKRWDESPLTLGAKMGLHEFVERILKVCPQSALYLDSEGKNILQVAIQNGQEKIVGIVESMATGPNAVLPSWLLSSIDENTQNTILHFAAETVVKESAAALQMQTELQWFERVKKLVPKDLEYSRNHLEKTAQELFTENHKDMVKDAKGQLMEMGKTCSSLVAAVVFASSFSIPGDKDSNGNPVFYHRTAFKVFSHAYVIGLSCASTSLVLFLSLLTSPYREPDFRRSLPTKYFFANMSFFLALVALLVAFSCNIYLNIYGGRKAETKEIVPLVCELTIFPAFCCFVLLYRGSTFGLVEFLQHFWR